MAIYQIEVRAIAEQHDMQAQRLAREILNLPRSSPTDRGSPPTLPSTPATSPPLIIRTAQLYILIGNLTPTQIDHLTGQLLIDPVTQTATITSPVETPSIASAHRRNSMYREQFLSSEIPYQSSKHHTHQWETAHIVDIFYHPGVTDTLAESVLTGASMLGITNIDRVETGHRYWFDPHLSTDQIQTITHALLYNPVIQHYTLHPHTGTPTEQNNPVGADLSCPPPIYRPETLDHNIPPSMDRPSEPSPTSPQNPVHSIPLSTMTNPQLLELSKNGMLALNLDEMQAIQQHYRAQGREPTDVELETIAQTWSEHCSHKTFKATINYREIDSNGNLLAQETIPGLLKHYIMRATEQLNRPWVVSAFSDNAGIIHLTNSDLSDTSSNPAVNCHPERSEGSASLSDLTSNNPAVNCHPERSEGSLSPTMQTLHRAQDDKTGFDIAFKVETHNHPSAIEPFGGANTGVGGVIRDILGVSAQPIACTDILCFGPPGSPAEDLPTGMLSPQRIASGVVNGVRDYGNKMGIPTVNGAVLYHPGYIYNPLVFCGCLGILPHGSHPNHVQPGDHIVVLGGRTGRDGIHGATFSSGEMSSETNAQAGSAVQIGAPITEKKVTDVIIQARDQHLYHAITDCGAGGFSSAIGEMAAQTGAHVELSQAPLKYQGLAPWEIWLSEAQERMILAIPPQHLAALQAICAIEEVEATVIGTFTNDHHLTITYHGHPVADLDMNFLHTGRPPQTLDALWTRFIIDPDLSNTPSMYQPPNNPVGADLSCPPPIYRPETFDRSTPSPNHRPSEPHSIVAPSLADILLSLLSHPTIASKETIIRRYDHEVQGATILKPLVGRAGNGPGDAAVLQPILDQPTNAAIILSNGINPLYGTIDPYHMATNAIDEALRNLTAVGGDIERAALLDNFCWGNPTDPVQLGMLVRAVKGCHDAALGFGTPFISGKDSLHNEYRSGDQRLPVIPTLLISAVGIIDNAAQTIDMSLKTPGNLLYLLGATRNELAGSHYASNMEANSHAHPTSTEHQPYMVGAAMARPTNDYNGLIPHTTIPQVNIPYARSTMKALGTAIHKGLVSACHDLSEGGLAVAAAEMALAGLLGLDINLQLVPHTEIQAPADMNTILLFSESPSRFLIEVSPEQRHAFESHMQTHNIQHLACVGAVTPTDRLTIRNDEQTLIDLSVAQLQQAWKREEVFNVS